jgi:hypothetical protein
LAFSELMIGRVVGSSLREHEPLQSPLRGIGGLRLNRSPIVWSCRREAQRGEAAMASPLG